ncbi:hypothetical protein C0J52_17542 [Blattella germanica]|nr:hypothetical protein C0J52_17542 [Blattella germanica]
MNCMMSWFDATGFANLAKSALKEAQKTIDKALDIKDEESHSVIQSKAATPASPQEDTDNFFASWGLKSSGEKEKSDMSNEQTVSPSDTDTEQEARKDVPVPVGMNRMAMSTSLWGSFTGSFFENPRKGSGESQDGEADLVFKQPKKISLFRTSSLNQEPIPSDKDRTLGRKGSWDRADLFKTSDSEEAGLCDDSSELGVEEGFSRSKLVVESEDGDMGVRSRLSSCEADEERTLDGESFERTQSIDVPESEKGEFGLLDMEQRQTIPGIGEDSYIPLEVVKRRESSTGGSYKYNRLSVISSESDKKSSESVEVIGSASSEGGSGFTTSPETDLPLISPGMSASSSATGIGFTVDASSPDSVEVIPDTPSSVEIIGEDSSGRASRTTLSSSPYVSPDDPQGPPRMLAIVTQPNSEQISLALDRYQQEKKNEESNEVEKISPESVEVIPEEEEDEEDMSVADDSYTSASESTATASTTIMEQPPLSFASGGKNESDIARSPHHKPYSIAEPTSSNESSLYSSTVSIKTDSGEVKSPLASTKTSQHSLALLDSSYNESLVLTEVQSKIRIEEPILTHGSMESSSEDATATVVTEDSSNEGISKVSLQQTSSYYVKTMLADAMGEDVGKDSRNDQLMPARDQSPISSESRSDMVKVESEQTSGHTSGDELETTTSSDIEIISSPNGDSSSTQSRQSPAKLLHCATRGKLSLASERSESPNSDPLMKVGIGKIKGHQRELSETSSGGSDDSHCSEVEKLLKRIAEMTEILEARELKLIELSRTNVELHESNSDLKSQLEATVQSRAAESQDIHQITEEYTQRLSTLERKFQQAIREKETLWKQLEQAKQDAASRLSMGELESLVTEKDEIIRELREEGEKLSKQQLQHSNIIKKLRAKEKETDNTIKNQKDQLDVLSEEVERLKRSLAAKDEVERTQIEAVHQLTARTKRQEKELASLRGQLDDTNHKLETTKESLELAKKELTESKKSKTALEKELKEAKLSVELSAKQELMSALEDAQRTAQDEREQLMAQIEDLRLKLRQAEEQHSGREANVRQECTDLLRRLERAEARNEELAQSVSVATRPLLRQLESLQAASSAQQASWEKQERNLSDAVSELQSRVSSLTEQERASREQSISLRSTVSSLESKLAAANKEALQYKTDLELQHAQCNQLRQAKDKEISGAESLRHSMTEQLAELRREDQLREKENGGDRDRQGVRGSSPTSPRSSPTLSFGRVSLSESLSSNAWPQFQDDAFECGSSSGRYSNVYDSLRAGNTTSLLEGLQSQLKLRDGEVQQLQWEMSRRDVERNALTSELSQLTARVEEQETRLKEAESVRGQFQDLQHKYDALLQMYGEKVEEAQELQLDLEDVKEMYKTQINLLSTTNTECSLAKAEKYIFYYDKKKIVKLYSKFHSSVSIEKKRNGRTKERNYRLNMGMLTFLKKLRILTIVNNRRNLFY